MPQRPRAERRQEFLLAAEWPLEAVQEIVPSEVFDERQVDEAIAALSPLNHETGPLMDLAEEVDDVAGGVDRIGVVEILRFGGILTFLSRNTRLIVLEPCRPLMQRRSDQHTIDPGRFEQSQISGIADATARDEFHIRGQRPHLAAEWQCGHALGDADSGEIEHDQCLHASGDHDMNNREGIKRPGRSSQ